MRILVVEDNRDMNRLIQRALTKAGYTVDGCFDGEEALDFLAGAEYDGVVLDVMMPKMDGHQLLTRLRASGSDIPVLFLTARDAVADRVAGLDLGADDYLVKPFAFEELLARIRATAPTCWRWATLCWTPAPAPPPGRGGISRCCPRSTPFWNISCETPAR